ncbi:MAG TPA: FkbM family methyltransferase [Planctomycetota bacterium]|nr:FkbM family methyltransferase [Planctomycetota bacterium]
MKRALKGILQYFGYQLRRTPKAATWAGAQLHNCPYYDQTVLLGAEKVQTVLDLGAHVGQTAERYRGCFPRAKIISFEPFPESFAACQKAAEKLQPMDVYALAAADEIGSRTFYLTSFSARNSLLRLDESKTDLFPAEWSKRAGEIKVEATTLDTFCRDKNIDRVDILKMDIQGGELQALRGAKELLARQAIDAVFLEVSFEATYDGHPLFFELYRFLHEAGFVLFDLYNCLKGTTNMALVEGDALFIRKTILEK